MADIERHDKAVRPPTDFVLLSATAPASTIAAPEGTRGLLIGTAGDLNITTKGGGDRDGVPFQLGITPIEITAIRATGMGSATNIWAVI